ncbi:hypothetical protein CCM_06304 [Cordyceps militaris CM01]|uniref:Uncharacterized protein n=2 Tax=Cordyceps militaris TaxID=73501 RepID=G3JJW0_CORMM|nr:uncharacterized protein CCM_06304 [Cordyceps militaris CM01]ATY58927.1 hypothetical protein A9K55_003661 [Cordyceps militaris]EGX92144.1 hypothetical protein CCM_06304 [Cordyceps militaris CM01]
MSDNAPPNAGIAHRRSSITQAALSNLFQRGPSNANVPPLPGAPSMTDPRGRRLSVSTIGLSGSSPTNPAAFNRRESISTNSNSGSIDESAVEDDDFVPGSARTTPNTPFTRRMSFGASAGSGSLRGYRPSGSPGNGNTNPTTPPTAGQQGLAQPQSPLLGRRPSTNKSPPMAASAGWSVSGRRPSTVLSSSLPQASFTMHKRAPSDYANSRADQQGFNWSEQLRSRAESSVSAARPSFSLAQPQSTRMVHDRARSVSEMAAPPNQAPAPMPPRQEKPKPDAFQERILKGDFYMD